MPSYRRQVNVRVDPETEKLMEQLLTVLPGEIGLQVSQSDLFRLGLVELRKKYLDGRPQPPAPPEKPAGKPKRKK